MGALQRRHRASGMHSKPFMRHSPKPDRDSMLTVTNPRSRFFVNRQAIGSSPHNMSTVTTPPQDAYDSATEPTLQHELSVSPAELTLRLQQDLAAVLQGITEIKQNCNKLETENKFIREYIASIMNQSR